VSASDFRDHWRDTEPEWLHGGTWLTSVVLLPKVVGASVASATGHVDLPFLAPVPAAGMHITVQRGSPRPDPIEAEMAHLLDAVEEEFARVDAFETLAASGSVYFDVLPHEPFAALGDGVGEEQRA
jgi:hypothetical protein